MAGKCLALPHSYRIEACGNCVLGSGDCTKLRVEWLSLRQNSLLSASVSPDTLPHIFRLGTWQEFLVVEYSQEQCDFLLLAAGVFQT